MVDALAQVLGRIHDPLPRELIDKQTLAFDEALRDVHFPANKEFRGIKRSLSMKLSMFLFAKMLADPSVVPRKGYAHKLTHQGIAI